MSLGFKTGNASFSCGMPAAMHEPQATQQRESYLSYSGWGNPIWRLPKKRVSMSSVCASSFKGEDRH